MDDLIKRKDAILMIQRHGVGCFDADEFHPEEAERFVIGMLEKLPSAEPEIIHCRDCKYAHLTYDGSCKHCDKWVDGDGTPLTLYLDGDFYCGFAERRTDE